MRVTPVAVSVTELAALLAGLEGRPGGNGGTATPPTDAILTRSGIDEIISGNLIDEAAVAAFGLNQMAPGVFGLGRGQGPSLTTNRCVTVSPSQPCRSSPAGALIPAKEGAGYVPGW